jgi:exosortase family protein XrtF
MIKEFRPALMFLAKFLAIYFLGNIIYGIYIESFNDRPDAITRSVTRQTVITLNVLGYQTRMEDHPSNPKVRLKQNERNVLNVFEGCNGINVMIVFVAFLFAFGGPLKKMMIFLPIGLLIIHLANLLRISLLFDLALHNQKHFYYYHKYFFTATLYLIVFALWAVWVIRFNEKQDRKATV